MPMFRVTLSKAANNQGAMPKNPFLIRDIFSPRWTHKRLCRSWDIPAADEAEVRALLDAARKEDIDTVRGFDLDSIERLPEPQPAEPL